MNPPGQYVRRRRLGRAVPRVIIAILVIVVLGAVFIVALLDPFLASGNVRASQLARAAAYGDIRQVDHLVARGADPNARGRGNITPLLYCLRQRNKEGFAALLRHGADPNVVTRNGQSVMHEAAGLPDSFWLRAALTHGGDPNLLDVGNRETRGTETPLFRAIGLWSWLNLFEGPEVANRLTDNVRLLIEFGADVNHRNYLDRSPLRNAGGAVQSNYETVFVLLQAGADFERRPVASGISYVDIIKAHNSPATIQRLPEEQRPWFHRVVRFLIEQGADLDDLEPTLN